MRGDRGGDRRSLPRLRCGGGGAMMTVGMTDRVAGGLGGELKGTSGKTATRDLAASNESSYHDNENICIKERNGTTATRDLAAGNESSYHDNENICMKERNNVHDTVDSTHEGGKNPADSLLSCEDSIGVDEHIYETHDDLPVGTYEVEMNVENPGGTSMNAHIHAESTCMGHSMATGMEKDSCPQAVCLNVPGTYTALNLTGDFQKQLTRQGVNATNAWKRPTVVAMLSISELGTSPLVDGDVQLDQTAVNTNLKKFEAAMVGHMFGRRLPFLYLNAELKLQWYKLGHFRLITISADSFICFFSNAETRDTVLMGGHW